MAELHFRFRPGVGLEAKYAEDDDLPHNWRVSLVPTIHEAIATPGMMERMIKARDDAATAARPAYLSEEWMDEAERWAVEDGESEWDR